MDLKDSLSGDSNKGEDSVTESLFVGRIDRKHEDVSGKIESSQSGQNKYTRTEADMHENSDALKFVDTEAYDTVTLY